jgi:L-threonylcarbamoyladenylate synthase
MGLTAVRRAVEALRAGALVVIPTDTVYGLVGRGDSEEVARELYRVKGRSAVQPSAALFASMELLADRLPELADDTMRVVRALLPGPVTLVLPNSGRHYSWLNVERPETIGVRVPDLVGPGRDVLDALGVLVATSANLPSGPDPRRLEDVPHELLAAVAAVVDGGELPGTPSTVIDLTAAEPRVLREGAVPAHEALGRARAARDA